LRWSEDRLGFGEEVELVLARHADVSGEGKAKRKPCQLVIGCVVDGGKQNLFGAAPFVLVGDILGQSVGEGVGVKVDDGKRIPGAARSFFHRLARARGDPSAGLVSLMGAKRGNCSRGVAGCPRWVGGVSETVQHYRAGSELGKGAALPQIGRSSFLEGRGWADETSS